jgi:site-specific DNA-cytosine methylase
VLDAQHFGVPQRRRRVFIVGCLGDDWRTPAQILAIREGRIGYFEASQSERKDVAAATPRSSRIASGEIVGTLQASDHKFPQQQQAHENKIVILGSGKDIANTIPAELYHHGTVVNQDANNGHLVVHES